MFPPTKKNEYVYMYMLYDFGLQIENAWDGKATCNTW